MRLISEKEVKQYPHSAVLSLEVTLFKEDLKESEEKGKEKEEPERKESNRRGTGFLVGDRYVLTAAHVVFSPISGFATTIKCHVSRYNHSQIKSVYVHKYVIPRSYIRASTLVYTPKRVEEAWDGHVKAKNSPESFNEEKIDKTLEESERLASYDYALLYLDESIDVVIPIIPIAYYTEADDEPFCDVMLCGYPTLEYRFSQQFVSGFVKAKEQVRSADIEVIRLSKRGDNFEYTTLEGKKVNENFDTPVHTSIDILNKDENAREEILMRIFEIGHKRQLYPAIGLTPYEANASLTSKTRDLMKLDTPSYHGMSGSPIRFTIQSSNRNSQPPKWYAGALLSQGNKQSAVGCRFTQEKIEVIREWKGILPELTDESIKDMSGNKNAVFKIMEKESIIQFTPEAIVQSALSNASSAFASFKSWFPK